MSEIKVGDLVVVVKPTLCCGRGESVGKIFTVTGFRKDHLCVCGDRSSGTYAVMDDGFNRRAIARLRRIPPLSELETTEHKEETPA